MSKEKCDHFGQVGEGIKLIKLEETEGCFECLKIGGSWVNLRQCITDGLVRCCDSSPNKHATEHYNEVGHPVVVLLEHNMKWCYIDEMVGQEF